MSRDTSHRAAVRDGAEDARSADPVQRLLEDSWQARGVTSRRELLVEGSAAAVLLACAVPLALVTVSSHSVDVPLALVLVALYAVSSRMLRFPIGAGYVVPSWLFLVPILLLLPPGLAPLLTIAGLVLGTLVQVALGGARPARVMCAIPDAWHALGPALVLVAAGGARPAEGVALLYIAAFAAGCLFDLVSATLREWAIAGITSRVQLRVIAQVWLIDACIAPLGLLVAEAMRVEPAAVLLVLPLNLAFALVSRERTARIEQAQMRLDLLAQERSRLQRAVRRLGDALAVKLDIDALTDIVLRGSIDALDADAARLTLGGAIEPSAIDIDCTPERRDAIEDALGLARREGTSYQLRRGDTWALALPFSFSTGGGWARGAIAVARHRRPFRDDEEELMRGLVDRGKDAAADILAHQRLRDEALSDALTGLGNRRRLSLDAAVHLDGAPVAGPVVLLLFDLDGFKSYNDTFGHPAGDAILARLGARLADAVAGHGGAYRLGGDEFCVLLAAAPEDFATVIAAAVAALQEQGENFSIGASYGAVLLPHETRDVDYALQLADERMYAHKRGRSSTAAEQTRDVLLRILQAKHPSLGAHASVVTELALRVGRRQGLSAEELDELERAAELHDVGKVAIPDEILEKPSSLNAREWELVRQHSVLGERILSAAPALRPVAVLVRSTHERWDGGGYPDGLAGAAIPHGARIIAACDAYHAMTSERAFRPPRDAPSARGELLREAGAQFDPAVVEVLLDELRRGAPGPLEPEAPVQSVEWVVAHLRDALGQSA